MGLHSKVRHVVHFKKTDRMEQKDEIIQFATGLYDFIFDYINTAPDASLEMTQKHARHVSKSFTFPGFEDDEVYCILLKVVEMKRKSG